jgi:hypothetical protein
MVFDILSPLGVPSWDSMLLRTPGASFFHGSAWARVLSESYGYTPLYFTVMEGEKFRALVPVMEVDSFLTGKRGVSLPFTDYCDPLIDETVELADRVDMFNQIVEFGKKRGWKYVELRVGKSQFPVPGSQLPVPDPSTGNSARSGTTGNLQPRGIGLDPRSSVLGPDSAFGIPQSNAPGVRSQEAGTRNPQPETRNVFPNPQSAIRNPQSESPTPVPFITYLGHTLDLTKGEKALHSGLRDSTRRNIKKAAAQGVEVRITNDFEGVREFYRLHCFTRKVHGVPPQPFSFFRKIYDRVISAGHGFLVLASHGGKNIAGSVFLYFGDRAVFKYGASDRKYQELRGNNLVMWEAIKWFAGNGFKSFCFGRTELGNEGLRQFKSGWGAEEQQIQYFKYDLPQGAFVVGKPKGEPIYIGIFRHTPIPVLNVIGSLLYRHIG